MTDDGGESPGPFTAQSERLASCPPHAPSIETALREAYFTGRRSAATKARKAALREFAATLPTCQVEGCEETGTREDCNCLYSCDDDEHTCHADGGPEDLPYAALVRVSKL